MRYKGFGQRSVLDNRPERKKPKKDFLIEVDGYVDWGIYRKPLERSYTQSAYGPPRYDVLVLFKMVLLQQWYDLSDPEVEEYVIDRLSFRRFLGLSVMDATFIQAPRKDPDARDGHKGHGYSVHTHADAESKLIRELEVTSAEIHDSQEEENLLFGDEQSNWADKGYFNDQKKREMRRAGVYCGVLDKAKRNHPISRKQKKRNIQKSRVRSGVEHPYAQINTTRITEEPGIEG